MCQQHSGVSLTSEASSVRGIHGNHGLGDAGWTADSCHVQGPHPKDVRTSLHQSCDREAGVLHWVFITLSPVMGAHLAPANTKYTLWVLYRLDLLLIIRRKKLILGTLD